LVNDIVKIIDGVVQQATDKEAMAVLENEKEKKDL